MKRLEYIDILRGISIIGVVLIHVISILGGVETGVWHIVYLGLTRFCVPMFFVCMGAILLQKDRELNIHKLYTKNYISLFSYLFISYQMSAKPYFIGSTGIFTFCSRSHIGVYLLMFSLSNVVNFVVNTSMLSDALSLFWHSQ